MTTHHLIKLSLTLSLGLGLLACTINGPDVSNSPGEMLQVSPSTEQEHHLHGSLNYNHQTETLTVKIPALYSDGFKTQGVQCGEIMGFEIQLHGPGLSTPLLPDEADNNGLIAGTGCSGATATFSSVPVGKNRVLWVDGVDVNNNTIKGADVSVVLDISNGSNVSTELNQVTHATGRIFEVLWNAGNPGKYLFSVLDYHDISTLISEIAVPIGSTAPFDYSQAGSLHPAFINVQKMGADIIASQGDLSQISSQNPDYRLSPGTLKGLISGGSGNYKIMYKDPTSSMASSNTGSSVAFNITNTTPGTWTLEAFDLDLGFKLTQTVAYDSSTVSFDFSSQIPVSDWGSLNGPYGGHVPSLLRLSSSTLLAGTSNGLFKSSNFDTGKTWQRVGLLNQEVISLSQPDISVPNLLYAGTKTGLYTSTNSGDSWSKIDDAALNGKEVHDVVLFNAKLYAALSEDGVAEKGVSSWSIVNTGMGNITVTDLENVGNNAYLMAAAPFSSNLFFSTIPGSGWTGFPAKSGTNPNKVHFVNSKLYTSDNSGRIYFTSDLPPASIPNWNAVSSTSVTGSIEDFAVVDYGTPDFRIYAGTNGSALQYSDFTSTWSDWADGAVGPPPINNPFVTKIDASFAQSDFSGLVAATKGGGVSEINNTGTFVPANTNLFGHLIVDMAVFNPVTTGKVIFVATAGGGVFRYAYDSPGWEALLNVPPPTGAPGMERYPQAIAVDKNGTLYAAHTHAIVVLPNAHTALKGSAWTPINDIAPSGTFESLIGNVEDLEAVGDKLYAAVSNDSAGDQGVYGRCIEGASSCGFTEVTKWEHVLANTSIFSLSHVPSTTNLSSPIIFAGGENAFLRANDGKTFNSLTTTNGYPTFTLSERITDLDVSETATDVFVYGTVQKNPLYSGSGQDGLLRYRDSQGTESADFFTDNINGSSHFNAVTVNPTVPDQVLLAVAKGGIWRAENATGASPGFTDYNSSTQSLTPGINNLMVNSMALLETDLFIGSFGQGVLRDANTIAP